MGNIHLPTGTGWIRRLAATLLITTAGLLAGLFIATPAGAATARDGGSAINAASTAREASAVGSGKAAEITATVVAGVLILGAAGGVIAYTARHREEFHEPDPR